MQHIGQLGSTNELVTHSRCMGTSPFPEDKEVKYASVSSLDIFVMEEHV